MKNRREDMQKRLHHIHSEQKDADKSVTYIFQNHKNHDYSLPKKSLCGKKMISPKQTFHGDEYFVAFVKTGDIRIIQVLQPKSVDTPEPVADAPVAVQQVVATEAVANKTLTESATIVCESSQGDKMEKLILDQPDKVTFDGKKEHLVRETPKVIKDHRIPSARQNEEDVLLTENPMAGIDVISD